jgi:hypothetical protein
MVQSSWFSPILKESNMTEKLFPRIGARSMKFELGESKELENANNCYCPHCGGGPLDGYTQVNFETDEDSIPDGSHKHGESENLPPRDGDASICMFCASLFSFTRKDGKTSIRKITDAEIARLKQDPDLWAGLIQTKISIENVARQHQLQGDRKFIGKKIDTQRYL